MLSHFGSSVHFASLRSCCKITEARNGNSLLNQLVQSPLTQNCSVQCTLWSFVQFRFKWFKQWVYCSLPWEDAFKGLWILLLEHCFMLFGLHVPSYESKSSASRDKGCLERRLILVKMTQLYFPESCL